MAQKMIILILSLETVLHFIANVPKIHLALQVSYLFLNGKICFYSKKAIFYNKRECHKKRIFTQQNLNIHTETHTHRN